MVHWLTPGPFKVALEMDEDGLWLRLPGIGV